MKTAIFGGAFDPFHNEHLNIIIAAHKAGCDRVVAVPSFLPPHKEKLFSSYEARREMVAAGTEGLPYVIIDDIERERGTTNPTSVILPILKQKYGDCVFLMGGDSVKNFHTWIDPQKIADATTLAVVRRGGVGNFYDDVERLKKDYGARVEILPYEGNRVSSSAVKAAVELGADTDDISSAVKKTIEKSGLYRQFGSLVERVREDVPERTFRHCASTVIYGEDFAGVNRLSYEEVFIACLLHDCAKHLAVKMEGVPAPVVHQFVGADRARERYGVEDINILNAIRYHTSGKPSMTQLEKLVFSADMLEPNRNFEGVEELRAIMDNDFEEGFRACVNATYSHLISKGGEIYPLTKECAEYYNNI